MRLFLTTFESMYCGVWSKKKYVLLDHVPSTAIAGWCSSEILYNDGPWWWSLVRVLFYIGHGSPLHAVLKFSSDHHSIYGMLLGSNTSAVEKNVHVCPSDEQKKETNWRMKMQKVKNMHLLRPPIHTTSKEHWIICSIYMYITTFDLPKENIFER